MALRVLGRLSGVLLLDRGGSALVGDGTVGDRARRQGCQHPLGLLRGLAHGRGVQKQYGRPLRARQPGGGDHRLDDPVELRQQIVDPLEQRLELVQFEGPGVMGHRLRQWMGLQVKAGDDTEEPGARAAGGPEQIGVLGLIGVNQFAVGGDHIEGDHALTRPPVLAAVPALTALQKEAAYAHARAMASGKRAPVLAQERGQLRASVDRRTGQRNAAGRVVAELAQLPQVDQKGAVAHAQGRPAVAPGADRNGEAALAGEAHAGRNVILVVGDQHGGWVSVGPPSVEHPADPRLLVAWLASPDEFPGDAHEIRD